jgi:hypothetical protein
MKSYVKIYGPPLGKAVQVLRKVAIETPEVCIMDPGIAAALDLPTAGGGIISGGATLDSMEGIQTFFGGAGAISEERCDTIISKSGESLGKYDFFYEWFQNPTVSQVEDLISKIDKALEGKGVMYTLTTK